MLAEAFGEPLTEQRQEIYYRGLAEIPQEQLRIAFRRARYELKWFPKLAELRELAGVLPDLMVDGRPGPEEAWARMPKGERIEDDSIVWCEEERTAYGACRRLLLEGDQIGARMAFKERYEKELAEARSHGRPVQWSVSVGYDIEHRLAALAGAVQEKRITKEKALDFVSPERRNDFAQMLPPSEAKGLLTGEVDKWPSLPGLVGICAKMRMEDIVPEELKESERSAYRMPSDRSADEARELRERAVSQRDFLMRSRNRSQDGAV